MSWDIIIWDNENKCDYVPTCWGSVDKKQYKYPIGPRTNDIKRRQMVHECEDLTNDCEWYPAICKKANVTVLETAKRFANQLMYTSNLESDGAESDSAQHMVRKKKKIMRGNIRQKPVQEEKSKAWNRPLIPFNATAVTEDPESGNATDANDTELWYMQLADGIAGVHHDASESAAGNSNSATAAEFQTTSRESLQSTFLVNSINNGTPMRNNARPISSQVAGIQENVKSVKSVAEALGTAFEISEIKKSISGLEKSVSRILTLLERREIPLYDQNTATDILNLLPLKSVDTVDHLETQLMEQNNMNGLVGILFLVGGESTHKSIYLQMAKLLDSQVSCQYSGIGKKGKIPFFKLKIFQAIQMATRKRFRDASDAEIKKSTALFLTTAKWRIPKNRGNVDGIEQQLV